VIVAVAVVLIAIAVFILIYSGVWRPLGTSPDPAASGQPPLPATAPPDSNGPPGYLTIMTWNLRGYPEKDSAVRGWFTAELARLSPHVICIQEIADQARVSTFMTTERNFSKFAFSDSSDGQDNAILACDAVAIRDLPDPQGFQHPAQTAYVSLGGFDATIITVHLSWLDTTKREAEKRLLKEVVAQALKTDPDVIVCGDFNTQEPDISGLATSCGLQVMSPKNVATAGTTHAGNRYDWFLVSPDLADEEAAGAEIVTFSGTDLSTAKKVSDHLPVRAWFRTDARFRDRTP